MNVLRADPGGKLRAVRQGNVGEWRGQPLGIVEHHDDACASILGHRAHDLCLTGAAPDDQAWRYGAHRAALAQQKSGIKVSIYWGTRFSFTMSILTGCFFCNSSPVSPRRPFK